MKPAVAGASFLIVAMLALACLPATAQTFPSPLKDCNKSQRFERVDGEYTVPVVSGGVGTVQVVSQNYTCKDSNTRSETPFSLIGLKDASGKLIIPYKYAAVLPFSTTGAVIYEQANGPSPKNLKYRTYIAGKGEGKDGFDFQSARMFRPDEDCTRMDAGRGVAAVIGEYWFMIDGGKSHVTLFTPSGVPRKLEYMGGGDIKPAIQRVGDVLLARWRDEAGVLRSGILDLAGRQIAPVLGNAALWSTLANPGVAQSDRGCFGELSYDLFIEGPSLDQDPAQPFYGPLLTLVARDGTPAPLPEGAAGLFPVIRHDYNANRRHANNTTMWAVVFPKANSFEFTLHLGTPTEALITAETAPRYDVLDRTTGGYVMAKADADQRWRVFRKQTDLVFGEPHTDLKVALASANAILDAEAQTREQALAAAWARQESGRKAGRAAMLHLAREQNRLCQLPFPWDDGLEWVQAYVESCDARSFYPGDMERARTMGVPNSVISASLAKAQAIAKETGRQAAEFEVWLREDRKTQSSYIPGQWESAMPETSGSNPSTSRRRTGSSSGKTSTSPTGSAHNGPTRAAPSRSILYGGIGLSRASRLTDAKRQHLAESGHSLPT